MVYFGLTIDGPESGNKIVGQHPQHRVAVYHNKDIGMVDNLCDIKHGHETVIYYWHPSKYGDHFNIWSIYENPTNEYILEQLFVNFRPKERN